jgi:hypothetical protein
MANGQVLRGATRALESLIWPKADARARRGECSVRLNTKLDRGIFV